MLAEMETWVLGSRANQLRKALTLHYEGQPLSDRFYEDLAEFLKSVTDKEHCGRVPASVAIAAISTAGPGALAASSSYWRAVASAPEFSRLRDLLRQRQAGEAAKLDRSSTKHLALYLAGVCAVSAASRHG